MPNLPAYLLLILALTAANGQHVASNFESTAGQKSDAEQVFVKTASKVVFLIMSKSGEIHARASGVILTADGYVATNYHALQGADAVEIRFFPDPGDSENYKSFNGAKLLYADAERDIAVLKVNSDSLPFLQATNRLTGEPRVGETVFAIGNPKGLSNTISEGIVSALRAVGNEDVIQHTAAISPGSSGGALVDSDGALLGMNSWQVADAQNLNFAIAAKYIFGALAAAHHNTAALSFPPEAPAEDASAIEDEVWQAFQSRDYIQAANQAEQAVAAGFSNSKIYMVLGIADFELGKQGKSEQYLWQSLRLAGPDDKFKQTSRLYLLRILAASFNADSTSVDHLSFIRLVNEFLASESGSVADPDLYSKMRTWAASLPAQLRSINGVWTEDSSTLVSAVACKVEYVIASLPSGSFSLGFKPSSPSASPTDEKVVCTVNGTIVPSSEGFEGEIDRAVILDPSVGPGSARQKLHVQFRLSDDLMMIEGTATGQDITEQGPQGGFAREVLSFPPGPKGHWHFTLRRVQ